MRRNAINMPFGKLKRNSNEKKCHQYVIRKIKKKLKLEEMLSICHSKN